jgi:DNA ligase (NAD+)
MVDSGIVPLEIDYRDAIEVRGEVNCAEGAFTALNTQLRDDGLKPYSNARNAVAGWMSSASPHLAICQFTLYDAMGISDSHVRNKEVCAGLGFTTAKTLGTFKLTDTLETITDIFTQSASQRSGSMTDCLWDGLVYKLDSHIDRLAIGGNDTAPIWAIAHKYPPSEATTTVVGITFTVGIDGRITPVCQCDPVEIGGVIVSECTLHSMHRLHDLNISVGDTVSITRNGDVIPHLHSVVYRPTTRMETADYAPKRCPSCQSMLETVGKHLYCENHEQCPSQELSRHLRFVSERGFNIDELGPERLKVVLQQGVLLGEGVSGWYSDGVEDRLATALNSATVARKIISAFEVAKDKISLANYLYALYIPGCGYTLSKKLSYHVRGIQDILSMPNTQLMEITQLKEHAVIALKTQLMSSRIQEADHWMTVRGIIPKTQITTIRGSVVITGSLSQSRQAIVAMLERYGYTTTTSVNQTTMAVICGDAPSMSKVNRAVKLNIPRWTESQLTEHLNTIHPTE